MAQVARRVRRTQEERSAETRAKLLDATIDCLVNLGYARTTTTEVADRSGLSRGAQLHHFPTKAELVEAAIEYLAEKLAAEYREAVSKLPSRADRVSATIDVMWKVAQGPLFAATLELLAVARTDPNVRAALDDFYVVLRREMETSFVEVFGEGQDVRRIGLALGLSLAVINGLALEQTVNGLGQDKLLAEWKAIIAPLFTDR